MARVLTRITRILGYLWPLPWTLIGIAAGLLLGGNFRCVRGVIEIHGRQVAWVLRRLWVPADAITIGHVVLGQSVRSLRRTRAHERVHVRQYERWGIAMVPAYLAASVYLYLTGRDPYRQNPFEREAFAADAEPAHRHR